MERIAVVGGGAAGMMAAVSAAETVTKSIFLKKMKSLGRRFLLPERDGVI